MSQLVSLHTWAAQTYGEDAPCMATLLRWTKRGQIQPAPVKHGRAYFVAPDAVYTERSFPSLVDRIHADREKANARRLA